MIRMQITHLFFDKKAVRDKVDRTTRRVFSRFGAFVRRTAQSSIRRRKKTSAPESPPSSHTGLLKRFIYFGYNLRKDSVVIGPARLTKNNRGEAPSLLEYGGTETLIRRGKRQRVKIRPRPFMGPAFKAELPKLPEMWRDSVR